jgi:hypothetical protein
MTISRIPSVEGGIQPTLLTAKGDLISATAASTVARLAVGSNDQILVADSTASTGLKWATPSSTFVGAYAYAQNSTQAIPATTATTLLLPTELYDTDGFHSTSSNTSRMTVPSGKAGKYLITVGAYLGGYSGGYSRFRVFKNGSEINDFGLNYGQIDCLNYSDETPILQGDVMVSAAVADYFEIGYYNQNAINNTYAFFGFSYLGA